MTHFKSFQSSAFHGVSSQKAAVPAAALVLKIFQYWKRNSWNPLIAASRGGGRDRPQSVEALPETSLICPGRKCRLCSMNWTRHRLRYSKRNSQHANDPRVVAIESCGACPPGHRMCRALCQLSILSASVRQSVCLCDYCHCLVSRTIDPCRWQGHICVSTRELVSSLRFVSRLAFRALFSALPVNLCNILQQWDSHTYTDRHTQTEKLSICQLRVKLRNSYETIFHPP